MCPCGAVDCYFFFSGLLNSLFYYKTSHFLNFNVVSSIIKDSLCIAITNLKFCMIYGIIIVSMNRSH